MGYYPRELVSAGSIRLTIQKGHNLVNECNGDITPVDNEDSGRQTQSDVISARIRAVRACESWEIVAMTYKERFRLIGSLPLSLILILTFALSASAEWKEKVLYSFQGLPNDGAYPVGGVVFDTAGNLYGATGWGGASVMQCPGIAQCGIVYELSPPTEKGKPWTETVLHVFKGVNYNDGNTPQGGLIIDQVGNLYGTTAYGGSGPCELFGGRSGCGTVFELIPPKEKGGKWTEKVLHSFQSGKDGYFPWGDLTFDSAGNLYGATQFGGGYGNNCDTPYYQYCGTVFEVSPPKAKGGKWAEKVLYAFKSGDDGAAPNGGLVFDREGDLYGTTEYGGDTADNCGGGNAFIGCGTVFELTPSTKHAPWTEKILLHFRTDASMGGNPAAGVIFGPNGDLYGTTYWGGQVPTRDSGTVFKLSHGMGGAWKETLLHSFPFAGFGGFSPEAGVSSDSRGNLYGSAAGGGTGFSGTIYRLQPLAIGEMAWTYGVLYDFQGPPDDGHYPTSALITDKAGQLYGTTFNGGTGSCQDGSGCGTVFALDPPVAQQKTRMPICLGSARKRPIQLEVQLRLPVPTLARHLRD